MENLNQLWLDSNAKFFDVADAETIRVKLKNLTEDQMRSVKMIKLKDPTMMLVISILVGELGVDRFMLGDTGMGILKLLTCGLGGILWVIDLFKVQDMAKKQNGEAVLRAINRY